VDVPSDVLVVTNAGSSAIDLESVFIAHYGRIARVLSRLVHDRARAEELAVDVGTAYGCPPTPRRSQ
jgi:hypothetical protein